MKKIALLVALLMIFTSVEVLAIPYDFYGGVADEIEYNEVVFLSGRPVVFSGTYTADQRIEKTRETTHPKTKLSGTPKKGTNNNTTTTKTETYTFDLISEDGGTLSRQMSFQTVLREQEGVMQSTGNTKLTSWSETVVVDGNSYVLNNYFFSKANTNDLVPVADFYKSAIKMRRIYSVNNDEATVTLNSTGNTTGYYNLWGNAESIKLENSIVAKVAPKKDNNQPTEGAEVQQGKALRNFKGSYTVNVNDAHTTSLQFDENEGNPSSIRGSDIMVEKYEAVSKYTYNMPIGGKGEISLSKEKMPFLKPLIAPKFRDVNGIAEEESITKFYAMIKQINTGLGVFVPDNDTWDGLEQDGYSPSNETITEDYEDIFHPRGRLTRIDFIRAFLNLTNMRYKIQTEPTRLEIVKDRNEEYNHKDEDRHNQKGIYALNYENYFLDIKDYHPDYELIENGVKSGVIKGRRRSRFRPDEYITKEEIATFFVRALGMENRAPNPAYYTEYSDDANITGWSRDAVYMATQIGLFEPDEDGNFNPQDTLTRAEGAEILMRFVEFLEKDLSEKYQDIIKY